ncbi:MAG: HAD-IA family hydrolase [Proteobacteria bacterium]|nr:HAD-IA family hydrolase [Pseudomonadota bacterium]
MPPLEALLWDVDGTLAETERDGHRVAFNMAFTRAGLGWRWDDARYGALLHVTGGRERLLADMANRADAPAARPAREDLARTLHASKNAAYAWLVAQGRITAREGVVAVIEAAHAAGLRQAIVTTTSRVNVEALLPRLLGSRWATRFATVVCGEDVARKKPAPDAYQLALALLHLPPSRALAIEDSPPGVAAARAAGLAVARRPSHYFAGEPTPAGPLTLAALRAGFERGALS